MDLCSTDDDEPPHSSQPIWSFRPPTHSSSLYPNDGHFFEPNDEPAAYSKLKAEDSKKRKSAQQDLDSDVPPAPKKRRSAEEAKREREEQKAAAKVQRDQAKLQKQLDKQHEAQEKKARKDTNKLRLNKKTERKMTCKMPIIPWTGVSELVELEKAGLFIPARYERSEFVPPGGESRYIRHEEWAKFSQPKKVKRFRSWIFKTFTSHCKSCPFSHTRKIHHCHLWQLHVPPALAHHALFKRVLEALRDAMGSEKFAVHCNDDVGRPDMVRWSRKETSTYSAIDRQWMPCEENMRFEDCVMFYTTASAVNTGAFDPLAAARARPNDQVFLMIHGLRQAKDRAIHDYVEGILARVQILQKCFMVHVDDARDAAESIINITGDLAVRPYKIIEMTHLPFTPHLAKKCGRGQRETYLHMLAMIPNFTEKNARSIAAAYPTFDALFSALEAHPDARSREMLFVGLPMVPSKPGRNFARNTARKLVDVLLAEDPFITVG